MSEIIRAVTLTNRPRKLVQTGDAIPFYAGEAEPTKYLVPTDKGDFVRREYLESTVGNLAVMTQVGLPVPKAILVNRDEGFILVPDVKPNGKELYGQSLLSTLGSDYYLRSRPREDIDPLFIAATSDQNFGNVEKAVQRVISKADRHNIELPHDDPMELLVDSEGTYRVVILDAQQAETEPTDSEDEKAERRAANAESFTFFTEDILIEIRNKLMDEDIS